MNQADALYPCSFVIFGAIVTNLAAVGLNRPRGLHRIVVEKPFGEDIESGQRLNQLLHRHFDEQQIYRIDHYLAAKFLSTTGAGAACRSICAPANDWRNRCR